MKHLESFEAAAESLGKDPKVLPGVEGLEPALGKATVAAYKLFVISQAAWVKAGKKIDWKDSDQYKYYPCCVRFGCRVLVPRLRLRLLGFDCRLPPRFS